MPRRTRATHAPENGTGEALFLTHLDLIERVIKFVCARRHLSRVEAEDFASHVKLKFIEDDYAILTTFQGRSTLRTFLTVVIQRLFLDYRTSAWGKWRPSAEAKRNGDVAVLLEELVFRDGHSFEEACELAWTNHNVTLSRQQLEALIARLPKRAKRRFVSEEALKTLAASDPGPDTDLAERERCMRQESARDALRRIIGTLETQDRLILTMKFEDGRTVRDIAAICRLEHKALFRRIAQLLRHIRKRLEAEGIDGTSVL